MLDKIFANKQIHGPILTILIAILVYMICKKIIAIRLSRKKFNKNSVKRRTTIIKLFQNIFKYILLIISIVIILEIYGVNVEAIIAGLGIVGLVLGLALQDTIKDFLGGLTIIFDDYYAIGDWIVFKGFKGEVITFGLRSTKLRSNNGDIMSFANRNVTEIINFSKNEVTLVLDITADTTNDNKFEDILKKSFDKILSIPDVIEKNSVYIGLNELLGNTAVYRIKMCCEASKEFEIKREAIKIIKLEIDKHKDVNYPKIEVNNANKN